jgi:hypothetical protein
MSRVYETKNESGATFTGKLVGDQKSNIIELPEHHSGFIMFINMGRATSKFLIKIDGIEHESHEIQKYFEGIHVSVKNQDKVQKLVIEQIQISSDTQESILIFSCIATKIK